MIEKIAIVCYDFPPNWGVGGRRSAKLAKGLAKRGVEVYVIKAEPLDNKVSPWTEDVRSENIHISTVKRKHPKILSRPKKDILSRLKYKLALFGTKIKHKGTPYDIGLGVKEDLQNQLKYLINNKGINHVFVSGAPFSLFSYVCELKQSYPTLKVVCDYRDPWITAENYGMKGLSRKRLSHELKSQDFVFKYADSITTVNPFLLEEIMESGTITQSKKFRVLPHFYDPDDYSKQSEYRNEGHRQTWIYGGTVYLGVHDMLRQLDKVISKAKKDGKAWVKNLQLVFYTKDLQYAEGLINNDIILFKQEIGKNIFQEIHRTEGVIILSANHNKNFLTTKFFEYLHFNKPFIHFGVPGIIAKTIEMENLGFLITDPSIDIELAMKGIKNQTFDHRKSSLYENHSLTKVVNDLIVIFNSLDSSELI